MKLFITTDKVIGADPLPSFVVCDLKNLNQKFIPYQIELDSHAALNSGRMTFRPFGICMDGKNIYIASNDRLGKFCKSSHRFLGTIAESKLYVNTHQITKHKELLYTTNTSNDSIGIFDGVKTEFFNFQSLSKVNDVRVPLDAYELDKKHINSVVVHNDFLYVVAHSDTHFGSAIYCVNPQTWLVEKRIPAGVACHGVQIFEDSLYTLSTGTGTLLEINLKEDKVTNYFVTDSQKFFLRGMQKHESKLYFVASTNFHNTDGSNGCYLHCFNLHTKQLEEKFDLAPIVVVNDILIGE